MKTSSPNLPANEKTTQEPTMLAKLKAAYAAAPALVKDLAKLKAAYAAAPALVKDLAEAEKQESDAAKILSELTDCGPSDEKTRLRISQSFVDSQVLRNRIRFLKSSIRDAGREIFFELKHSAGAWNGMVIEKRDALTHAVENALRPFYCGDDRQLEEDVRFLRCPAILQTHDAYFPFEGVCHADAIAMVPGFLKHVEKHSKILGISIV